MLCEIQTLALKVAYGDFIALSCGDKTFSGNIIALLGHNGAGKSTFMKCMLGLLPPYQGAVKLSLNRQGQKTLLFPEKHMAFCPESGSVFEDISVEEYVRFWCRVKHHDPNHYKKKGADFIERLNLSPLFKKLGRELSKGQRRRVQTAIGYLTSPVLFLFDEPFDGLDVQKTSELAEIMREQAKNMCAVISSHRMDVVERLADLVIVLQDGEIAASGSVDAVAHALCGQSFAIKGVVDHDEVIAKLKIRFPRAAVCPLGDQITVVGEEVAESELVKLIGPTNGLRVERSRASLTDVMNYHLGKVDWKRAKKHG